GSPGVPSVKLSHRMVTRSTTTQRLAANATASIAARARSRRRHMLARLPSPLWGGVGGGGGGCSDSFRKIAATPLPNPPPQQVGPARLAHYTMRNRASPGFDGGREQTEQAVTPSPNALAAHLARMIFVSSRCAFSTPWLVFHQSMVTSVNLTPLAASSATFRPACEPG